MTKKALLIVAVFCLSVAAAAADDLNVGTWKLNETKSKVPAGAVKNTSVTYTAEGGSYKCVTDGTDAKGAKAHTEWTGKFDGKDYPLKGDASADSRAVTKVDAHHYKIANKKAGKAVLTGVVEISGDGKTRILTTSGTDAGGKKITATAVYERQ